MDNLILTQNNNPQPKSRFREFLDAFPIIQFVLAGAIGLMATYTTIQLSQNSQAAEIRRSAEKIAVLEEKMTPRELFDERTKTIIDEQKNQSAKIDRLLEK